MKLTIIIFYLFILVSSLLSNSSALSFDIFNISPEFHQSGLISPQDLEQGLIISSVEQLDYSSLNDPKNLVPHQFKLQNHFHDRTKFWFTIYGLINSHQLLLHRKDNLKKYYQLIDFSKLITPSNNILLFHRDKNLYSFALLRELFRLDNSGKYTSSVKSENKFLELLKFSSKKEKSLFYSNLRFQTGKADKIKNSLERTQEYIDYLESIAVSFEMPPEILAIPYLESMFSTNLKSKANAVGPWQFMSYIAKKFFIDDEFQSQSKGVITSSLGGLHLLKQNHKILKRWDLAITAYNLGVGVILKEKKLFLKRSKSTKNHFTLRDLISKSNNPDLGFASENFYSAFIALVYLRKYMNSVFKDLKLNHKARALNAYITNCTLKFKEIKDISISINNHLNNLADDINRGTLFFSASNLKSDKVTKLDYDKLRRNYPKNLNRFIRPCRNNNSQNL